MQIHLEKPNQHTIQSYSNTGVVVDDIHYENSIIISPTQIINPWSIKSFALLNETTLAPLLELKPDLILIGHQNAHLYLKPELMHHITQHKIGIECMSIGAACRTFNVLLSEGRSVVLGVIF